MTEPYLTPQSSPNPNANDEDVRRRRTFWRRAIWISIGGVIIPPMLGLLGTVVGMIGAFGELSKNGEADPEALAGDISVSLLTTAWSLGLSMIAFIVLIGALIRLLTLPKIAGGSPINSPTQPVAEQKP